MKYMTGEDIEEGDEVLIRGGADYIPGVVVKVLVPGGDDVQSWAQPKGGVLIEGGRLGLTLTERPEQDPELTFVRRAPGKDGT